MNIVQELVCQVVSCSSIRLRWLAPRRLGQPALHKYKLERQLQSLSDGGVGSGSSSAGEVAHERWVTANGELDDEDLHWQDSHLQVSLGLEMDTDCQWQAQCTALLLRIHYKQARWHYSAFALWCRAHGSTWQDCCLL